MSTPHSGGHAGPDFTQGHPGAHPYNWGNAGAGGYQPPAAGYNPQSQGNPYPPQGSPYPPQGGPYPPQGGPYPPQGGQTPPANKTPVALIAVVVVLVVAIIGVAVWGIFFRGSGQAAAPAPAAPATSKAADNSDGRQPEETKESEAAGGASQDNRPPDPSPSFGLENPFTGETYEPEPPEDVPDSLMAPVREGQFGECVFEHKRASPSKLGACVPMKIADWPLLTAVMGGQRLYTYDLGNAEGVGISDIGAAETRLLTFMGMKEVEPGIFCADDQSSCAAALGKFPERWVMTFKSAGVGNDQQMTVLRAIRDHK
ncbi:hypothetical protein [Tessaracoccus sp. OH4464_COT-324]|uniref:hypothetical protein n=1 Tax=Tessaracoccus sp. OH4464_COT-324 TaxID=2491059 RepID=UPI000F63217C|nr:hypothetical protein [Tessaracoccus sp. OH4464_COT-324]RRD46747.1 hypothetical protein EII42_05845 [Tessaracoccus sp. OH4464_COT-324]